MSVIDWSSLRHAYGPASDIPGLLTRAETAPASDDYQTEPWYSLWSALCHQDDVFSASYAAVPELIRIAQARADSGGIEALLLAASIELRRHEPGVPPLPEEVQGRYADAVAMGAVVSKTLAAVCERPDDPRRLEIASAVFTGDYRRAYTLLGEAGQDE